MRKIQYMVLYKILKKPFFGNFMVKWRSPLSETAQQEWTRIKTNLSCQGINGKSKWWIGLKRQKN